MNQNLLSGIGVLLLQIFLSEFLVVRNIRPDFLIIFILYVALKRGRLEGVLYGFGFGLLEDLVSTGSLFGLSPLTKSVTGFVLGFLCNKQAKINPVFFHLFWIAGILAYFLIYVYIRYQSVYENSTLHFLKLWLFTTCFTFVFIGIIQIIRPIHKLQ